MRVRHLSVNDLLPPTDDYITYEGSLTEPGCHETVTWVIPNKPIYITVEQVMVFSVNSYNNKYFKIDKHTSINKLTIAQKTSNLN